MLLHRLGFLLSFFGFVDFLRVYYEFFSVVDN